jgi:hypothetical protein
LRFSQLRHFRIAGKWIFLLRAQSRGRSAECNLQYASERE